MVAFTGRCLTHRAEIMWLHGAWPEALEEARRAGRRSAEGNNALAGGEAVYLQGEVHRLRGELAAAEDAYREASRCGREPQPGLALLRLAQGDAARRGRRDPPGGRRDRRAAAARAAAARPRRDRAGASATSRRRAAPAPSSTEIADAQESAMLAGDGRARAGRGRARRRRCRRRAGVPPPRRAAWQELEAPYEAARARALVGLACRALGDDDTAAFELEAARGVFAGLGAAPDLARVESLMRPAATADAHGLTRARAGGAPPRRGRQEQPGDRRRARPQRAHGRPPPAEHLRQARRLARARRRAARSSAGQK